MLISFNIINLILFMYVVNLFLILLPFYCECIINFIINIYKYGPYIFYVIIELFFKLFI